MDKITCGECKEELQKKRYWQRFCSTDCRVKHFVRIRNEEVAFPRKMKKQMASLNRTDLFAA
jgi:hypothetical protein